MRNLLLLCCGLVLWLSALGQRYDIYVGVDPVSGYHIRDSLSTSGYTDKARQSTIQYYAKFGYVLDNDLELRLGYKFGINESHADYNYTNLPQVYTTNEKVTLHAVDASVLKIIKYKFINFMAGGTFYYGYQPAYTTGTYDYGGTGSNYTINNYTGPRLQSFGFYINTSLYFRIYKFLYAGMDITNGFLLEKWIGTTTTTTYTYASNGMPQSSITQANHLNELDIEKSLLNMDIGLRFLFDTKKTAKEKAEGKNVYF